MKNQKNVAEDILREVAVNSTDAARLVLECIEQVGGSSLSRSELIGLVRRVIRAGAEAVRKRESTVSLAEAAWASVEARADLRPTSRRDLRHFVRRILRVSGAKDLALRMATVEQCRRILNEAFGSSRSSYVKGRVVLHSIFAYGIRREWCTANPVSLIETPRVREKLIKPLSGEEVARLLCAVEKPEHRSMRFSLHLLLYCGVRPAEVARLKDEDICEAEGYVIIRPQRSKTGGGRVVPLRGVSARGPYAIPRDWMRRWCALRRAAGFSSWVPDVCRHTFASYHAAFYRNLSELQLEMGHSDGSLLHSRYVSPVPYRDAELFWRRVQGTPH